MKTTLLIDADILLHTAIQKALVEIDWPDAFSSLAVDERAAQSRIAADVLSLRMRYHAEKAVLCVGDRAGNWRKELDPTYKANRVKMLGLGRRPPGFEAVERWLEETYEVVRWSRLEGDDVLGILGTMPRQGSDRWVIVSEDKDLEGVPGWLANPKKDEAPRLVDPVTADRKHLELTLIGDRSDGFPGCPGVGKIGAKKILDAASEGDLEGIGRRRWAAVVAAFESAGQDETRALLQARLARVLRAGEYAPGTHKVRLWTPPE